MNREEFIEVSVSGGYATRKVATMYADSKNKKEFNNDDLIEVYRIIEDARATSHMLDRFRSVEGNKTTKRFKEDYNVTCYK